MQEEIVNQVKQRANIVDVIGHFMKLKRRGVNYLGLCPFHNEKTGSFTVSPVKQIYTCFGCGKSGDAIEFLQEHERKTFIEAVEWLASFTNTDTSEDSRFEKPQKRTSFKITAKKMKQPQQQKTNNAPISTATAPKNPLQVPAATMLRTQGFYGLQPLFNWFCQHFNYHTAYSVFKTYNVGTAKDGGTIFWQVDVKGRVAMAQKIKYNGFKRDKLVPPFRLYKTEDGYQRCFFGEHLLGIYDAMNINPVVCIVESEKSAIIASLYLPTLTRKDDTERPACWLASVGSNGLTEDIFGVLKGRDVVLFPDFKYINRAQWGSRPMCTKTIQETVNGVVRNRTVIAEDGVMDQSYQSAKTRILEAGARSCHVFDVCPAQETGDDIADYLIQSPRPVQYVKPDFNQYKTRKVSREMGGETVTETVRNEPRISEIGFDKFAYNRLLDTYPMVKDLVTKLNLRFGSVSKI